MTGITTVFKVWFFNGSSTCDEGDPRDYVFNKDQSDKFYLSHLVGHLYRPKNQVEFKSIMETNGTESTVYFHSLKKEVLKRTINMIE